MIGKQMKNDKGFTLIEMLLAMALGIVVLGVSIFTYNKQSAIIRTGNQDTQTRGMARLAMDALVTNIQRAGYGMPPGDSTLNNGAATPTFSPRPAVGIANASATSVTYRVNSDDITTSVSIDPTSSAANAFGVPLNTGVGIFSVNDQVVFFDVSAPSNMGLRVVSAINSPVLVSGTNYDVLSMSGVSHGVELSPIRDSVPVMINKFHQVTYAHNSGAQTITVTDDMGTSDGGTDDTTTIIASNVTSLIFTYYNSAVYGSPTTVPPAVTLPLSWANVGDRPNLGNIRRINVNITVQDQNENTVTTNLTSDITLRNMGI